MALYTEKLNANDYELTDRVVHINRVAKVVKGGRRFSFSALVVVGDGNGVVGVGPRQGRRGARGDPQGRRARAQEPDAHPARAARRIPHEIIGRFGAGRVVLRPASPGTGVIAGGGVRAVVESAGVRDVLSKSLGTSNPHNVVNATLAALRGLRDPEQRRAELAR